MSKIPLENISKDNVIKEYGNSFSTYSETVFENFGKNHSVIDENKFDGEALLNFNINKEKEYISKDLNHLYERKKKITDGLLSSLLQKEKLEKINGSINYLEDVFQKIDKKWSIKYLDNSTYLIPIERLHENQEVFVIDFFMKPFNPKLKVVKVKRADIKLEKSKIMLSYILDDVDGTMVTYDNTYKLKTNYDERYVFTNKEDALLNAERLVYSKIGLLVSNLDLIKKS